VRNNPLPTLFSLSLLPPPPSSLPYVISVTQTLLWRGTDGSTKEETLEMLGITFSWLEDLGKDFLYWFGKLKTYGFFTKKKKKIGYLGLLFFLFSEAYGFRTFLSSLFPEIRKNTAIGHSLDGILFLPS
jgi:hypothetical protein